MNKLTKLDKQKQAYVDMFLSKGRMYKLYIDNVITSHAYFEMRRAIDLTMRELKKEVNAHEQ